MAEPKSDFRTKVGKVTLKGGARLLVIPGIEKSERRDIEKTIREVLDGHVDADYALGGFAFVVWDKDGSSSCAMRAGNGCIPAMLAPDFVRNRLMAYKIIDWARD